VLFRSVRMSENPILKQAVALYENAFGGSPSVRVFAPGRVNLIGEHTDYNGGFVLPFALPFRTVVVGSLSKEKQSRVVSSSVPATTEFFEINSNLSKGQPEWVNYVKGTIFQYLSDLPASTSVNIAIASNVPIGSGLSSSASLEVAIATFLEQLFGLQTSKVTKALRCQKAEHDFADTPCGIMDQYISAMGKKGNLLLIDCRSNAYTLVPFGDANSKVRQPVMLITNSNVKHSLSSSQYPVRVKQCQEAVRVLSAKFPHIKALRDATLENLEEVREELSEVVYSRALHCVSEDIRTLSAVKALGRGDFKEVGEMMTRSHASLKEHFEVSCDELDLLVELALEVPGVYGSRMTGGGFGGCTITLVDRDSVRTLEMHLKQKYLEKTGKACVCYDALPSEGAGVFEARRPEKSVGGWDAHSLSLAVAAVIVSVGVYFAFYKKS